MQLPRPTAVGPELGKAGATPPSLFSNSPYVARGLVVSEVEAFNLVKADAFSTLLEAVEVYNNTVQMARGSVVEAVEAYNETVSVVRDFCERIATEASDWASDKSEKWTESDAGSAHGEWVAAWENVELDDIDIGELDALEIEDVEDLDEPDLDHADVVENLPEDA